jgi:hypothetical protein
MFNVCANSSKNTLRESCQLSGLKKNFLKTIKPDKAKITLIPHKQTYKKQVKNTENCSLKVEKSFRSSNIANKSDKNKAMRMYGFRK